MSSSAVAFWFDPSCPYTWITSQWLSEVARLRHLRISRHVMSLALINASKPVSAEYRAALSRTLGLARVCIAARQDCGEDALHRLYGALGRRIHESREPITQELVEASLTECRLPSGLVTAMACDEWDAALVQAQQAALRKVRADVGSPILDIDGTAFFGPVLTRIPRGSEAVRMWEAAVGMASFSDFCELKRGRTSAPSFA